ncbi:MAG: DUF2764 family protein [Parachlamydiaceae bacterium]
MAKYYFVGTLLPLLSFDAPPEISLERLEILLSDNLTERDLEKTLLLRRFYDILNLRAFWREEELDPRGKLSLFEIGEALVMRTGLPDYVYDFVDRYAKTEDRLHHFPFLLAKYFQSSGTLKDPFLRSYLHFEREMRLVMTAFRAKKLGRDLNVEFQYEDPEEDLIAQLLAQQQSATYEPPEKYRDLKGIFDKDGDNAMALQKALDQYRFEKVENMVDMADTFSIERILAYLVQYMIVEKWFELDKDKGIQIVDKIIVGRA